MIVGTERVVSTIFYFLPLVEDMIQFDTYFSKGLKPRGSYGDALVLGTFRVGKHWRLQKNI